MLALAEIDLGTLTPEQREAAVQAIMALETLSTKNRTLTEEKACSASPASGKTAGIATPNHFTAWRRNRSQLRSRLRTAC